MIPGLESVILEVCIAGIQSSPINLLAVFPSNAAIRILFSYIFAFSITFTCTYLHIHQSLARAPSTTVVPVHGDTYIAEFESANHIFSIFIYYYTVAQNVMSSRKLFWKLFHLQYFTYILEKSFCH